jgi:hypothetical protein
MATSPVTPVPGLASVITTGGTAVVAVGPAPNGGFIANPASATDQGLDAVETLYVNPVTAATEAANGTTFALAPGQSWELIPGQTTNTSVNAASSGHKFSVVVY